MNPEIILIVFAVLYFVSYITSGVCKSLYLQQKLNHHEEFKKQVQNVLNGATGNWDLRVTSVTNDTTKRYILIGDLANVLAKASIVGMVLAGVLSVLE